MQRRTRNRICIWVIVGGLLNFLAYTVVYAELGGDAKNGYYRPPAAAEEDEPPGFYIKGHFIRTAGGQEKRVSKGTWVYSYLHSISLWPTQGAMVICMMILARPHIIATMRENPLINGQTFITVVITVTALLCSVMTLMFTLDLIRVLSSAA